MIPNETGGHTFDRSVRYNSNDVYDTLTGIDIFLKSINVEEEKAFKINMCCEELMTNIVKHSKGRIIKQTFDIHIQENSDGIYITLKDAGKPFDPVKYGKKEMQEKDDVKGNEHLGLRLVTSVIPDITYKYMYGQNTVFISLPVDGGK
jgi:anti-sigma regulatory factor (Ser/Thr protein kinase)